MHVLNLNVERWSLVADEHDFDLHNTVSDVLDTEDDISCSTTYNMYDLDRICFSREYVH